MGFFTSNALQKLGLGNSIVVSIVWSKISKKSSSRVSIEPGSSIIQTTKNHKNPLIISDANVMVKRQGWL